MKLKHISLITVLLVMVMIGCRGEFGPVIEQGILDDRHDDYSYYTMVWYHGDIVFSKWEHTQTLTDSIVIADYKSAVVVKNAILKSK